MDEVRIPNYLDQLIQDDTGIKPICMHGVGGILKEMHVGLKKSLKCNIVKSIETLLNSSSRAYYNWLQDKRPIPVAKAKNLHLFWQSVTSVEKPDEDMLWKRLYAECSGFSVDSGKLVLLPKVKSPNLAYLVGAIFGDGCLYSHTKRKFGWKSRYGMQITDECKEYLQNVISPKLEHVFGVKSVILKGSGNWYTLVVHSKVIYLFLKNVLKVPAGKKKGKLIIPSLVKQSPTTATAFLRGLFDTDGWISKISVAKPSIGLSQSDDRFLKEIKEMLSMFGILIGGPYPSGSRKGSELRSFRRETINKFNKIIGFEHPSKKQNQHLTNVAPT